jgi:hypothetical protein
LLGINLANLALGIVPVLIFAGSVAAGIDDDPRHRRVFLLVYGLWAFTLAGWNWIEARHFTAWVIVWVLFGLAALGGSFLRRRS